MTYLIAPKFNIQWKELMGTIGRYHFQRVILTVIKITLLSFVHDLVKNYITHETSKMLFQEMSRDLHIYSN